MPRKKKKPRTARIWIRNKPKNAFATNMTAARIAKGLTQCELADRAGIHPSMVTWAEIQSRDLYLSTAIKIAKVLGVGLDELCGLKVPEEFEEKTEK